MKKWEMLPWGLANLLAPIPSFLGGVILDWILFFGIALKIWTANALPLWASTFCLLPSLLLLVVHVTSSIMAVIAGILRRKERYGILCSVLSGAGFFVQIGLWALMLWMAATH